MIYNIDYINSLDYEYLTGRLLSKDKLFILLNSLNDNLILKLYGKINECDGLYYLINESIMSLKIYNCDNFIKISDNVLELKKIALLM